MGDGEEGFELTTTKSSVLLFRHLLDVLALLLITLIDCLIGVCVRASLTERFGKTQIVRCISSPFISFYP